MPADAFTEKPLHLSSGICYRPLIPLLVAFSAGIFSANILPEHQSSLQTWIILPAMTLFAGILLYRICRSTNATVLPLALYFCLGHFALSPWLPSYGYQNHVKPYADGQTVWNISGTLTDSIRPQGFRTVCFLDHLYLSGSSADPAPVAVPGKLRVVIYGNSDGLHPGSRLSFTSTIKPFRNFKNPGRFDYVKYMAFQNTWGYAYTSAKKIQVQPTAPRFSNLITGMREKISDFIDQGIHGDSKTILLALLTGNRVEISDNLADAFNRAGISHILAISGLHIGIIASVSFFLFTWLLSHFSLFLRHAWTRKGAALLSLVPVLTYGFLAGMSPSTQRAVIMAGVFLMTFLVERDHNLINTVAVAAFIILIVHPPSLFSISFQLSFAAVLSIIAGLARFPRPGRAGTVQGYLLRSIVTFVLISALAIIGTAPLTMRYFNQISMAGIVSNLIFIPVIGFIVVPAGLFSVLILLPVWSSAASWGLKLCDVILTHSVKWVYWISAQPFAAVKTVTPSMLEITCFYLLFGTALYLLFPDPSRSDPGAEKTAITPTNNLPVFGSCGNFPAKTGFLTRIRQLFPSLLPRVTGKTTALIIAGITLTILAADVCYWIQKRWLTTGLTVSVLDVGQGNAALIEMPGGKCALIDGGGYSDNSLFDVGERVVAPFLWRKKIKTIDTVILTHYDADHVNGLIYILKHFNVRQVLATHDPINSLKNRQFSEVIDRQQIHYPPYPDFAKHMKISNVKFQFLYPPENFSALAQKDTWRDSNNNSMVVRISFDGHSILFPGDITTKAENELIGRGVDISSTVMMVPHHGSSSSSTQQLIDKVNPQYAIVSCGFKNRFGFPSADVLKRFEDNRTGILRTDINGGVSISADENLLMLTPFTGGGAAIKN